MENKKIKSETLISWGIKLKKRGGGVFFTDETGIKIFVFLNAIIFAFTTLVKNTPFTFFIVLYPMKLMFVTLFFHFPIFGVSRDPPQKTFMYWMKIGREINFQS